MALLTSARGIDFGSEPRHRVRLLFVIASVDGESHLRALAQLTELFREERHRERLAQATAPDPIVRIIEQYSASV
jgi:mannitol operon transcriptional antiterminator